MRYADQIILGKIYTLDTDKSIVEAMVVKDGIIAYLGDKDLAMKMKGENTVVYDYQDAVIYPGLMDTHTHGLMAGQRLAFECDLSCGCSMQEFVDILEKYIQDHPERKMYKGAGWVYYEEPKKEWLDKICADKPVILNSIDGHSMWLNSKALEVCGFTSEVAKKYGPALVHQDENGNPTGMLCEGPGMYAVSKFAPDLEQTKEGLLKWQEFAFSQGITAVGEALLDASPYGGLAYSELVKEGKWKLRTYAYASCQGVTRITAPEKIGEQLKDLADKYDSEYFKITGMKLVLDGVVEAHTGYLLEDYADQPGYRGVLNVTDSSVLTKAVVSANEAGFSVHIHTIGDGAIKFAMDSVQEAEESTCNFNARNMFAHLQVVRPEDIKRMADYNVGAVVAPLWATVDPVYMQQTIGYIGLDRAWKQYPVKSFVDAGATIAFHTDYPVSTQMNCPLTVYQAIKRRNPNLGARSVLDGDQGIDAYRALLAMTANPAYLFKAEDKIGTLQIGKVANASVYDRDFIDYKDVNDIPNAKLIATVVDGEEVYHC